MTNIILRSDGTTQLANIKSCVFSETVNSAEDLRPGCVSSACLMVECYGSVSDAPDSGEALTYYQEDSDGTQTLIGVFYAEPAITTRNTYKFVAYDAAAKLDCDYSDTLSGLTFPITIYDIVASACSVAGVTLGSASWALSTQAVQEFYSDNITCRNIIEWAAEIACCFVRCDTSGELVFDWYAENSNAIGITSGTNLVPYKQDGLSYENYTVHRISSVAVRPVETEGVAVIYPSSYSSVYAEDPNGDGNIVLYGLTATDADSDGNIVVTGDFNAYDTTGYGDIVIEALADTDNSFIIANNLLLTSASTSVMTAVATNIYTVMRSLPMYRPMKANLFSFNNPFRAGDIVEVSDSQGVSFTTVIMNLTQSASGAIVESTGNEYVDNSTYVGNTSKRLQLLNQQFIELYGDVVFKSNLTDGTTKISGDNILTGYISADRIAANSIAVSKLTGTIDNGSWEIDLDNGTLTLGTLAVGSITGTLGTASSGSWGIDFTNGTLYIGTISASSITSGQLSASYIYGGTLDCSNMTVSNLSASSISSGTLTSIAINNGSGTFSVDSSGNLTATSATITGTISGSTISGGTISGSTISGGTISGSTISGGTISGGTISGSTISGGTISGTSINNGSGTFYVDASGNLVATSATITGEVNASSGTISGNVVIGGYLAVTNSSGTSVGYMGGYSDSVQFYDYNGYNGIVLGNGETYIQGQYIDISTKDESSGTTYNVFSAASSYPSYYATVGNTNLPLEIYGSSITFSGGNVSIGDSNTNYALTLNGVAITGGSSITVDSAMSSTSTNPVQNKVIYNALSGYLPLSGGTMTGAIYLNNGVHIYGYTTSGYARTLAFIDTSDSVKFGVISLATILYGSTVTINGSTTVSGSLTVNSSYTLTAGGYDISSNASGTISTYIKYRKMGQVVFVNIAYTSAVTVTAGSWNYLGTLPSGCRPATEYYFVGYNWSTGGARIMNITTSGYIYYYATSSETSVRPYADTCFVMLS